MTTSIIQAFNDPRIKLFCNFKNLGFVKSFEKAVTLSEGEIIFFSDQDDFWLPGRVLNMASQLVSSNSLLLISQFFETNVQGIGINCPEKKDISNSFTWNSIFFGGSYFFGSTMCIQRDILKFILPFNYYVSAHDIHMAIIAKMLGKLKIIDNIYTLRTITGNNLSINKRSLFKKMFSRINYFFSIFHLLKKMISNS
jgi:hypothetical protein